MLQNRFVCRSATGGGTTCPNYNERRRPAQKGQRRRRDRQDKARCRTEFITVRKDRLKSQLLSLTLFTSNPTGLVRCKPLLLTGNRGRSLILPKTRRAPRVSNGFRFQNVPLRRSPVRVVAQQKGVVESAMPESYSSRLYWRRTMRRLNVTPNATSRIGATRCLLRAAHVGRKGRPEGNGLCVAGMPHNQSGIAWDQSCEACDGRNTTYRRQ